MKPVERTEITRNLMSKCMRNAAAFIRRYQKTKYHILVLLHMTTDNELRCRRLNSAFLTI